MRIPPESESDDVGGSSARLSGLLRQAGGEVALAFTGTMTGIVRAAANGLAERGVSTSIAYFPTVKPLDQKLLARCIGRSRLIVTVEEHSTIGGFGSAVAEQMAARPTVPLLRVGVDDQFCCAAGSYRELLDRCGISAQEIVRRVLEHR
ncbi:transketolase C-terminal domain-containing protein [Streptomyces sp. NBC_00878]|uniref:transketolase C-terminal domain-containing protein n=1 Tax=Streptomyces sp. NBC_00878 TaxID=2975854 RepID=UPI002259EC9A|nr:transketolase C-terminal domain-containing protein [Streptomyces sp. NBC_00878]MCX4911670.1 hypothetical protein [Streptomyces sp. NBC_00878]